MKFLTKFKQLGLKIDWATLFVGWKGLKNYSYLVSIEEIIEFATDYLSKNPELNSPTVMDIVISEVREIDIINQALYKLVQNKEYSLKIALRKWRLILLLEVMESLDENKYVDSLFSLSDFWISFEYPYDMPMDIQGLENKITPEKYYTKENCRKIIEDHKDWIIQEKLLLSK